MAFKMKFDSVGSLPDMDEARGPVSESRPNVGNSQESQAHRGKKKWERGQRGRGRGYDGRYQKRRGKTTDENSATRNEEEEEGSDASDGGSSVCSESQSVGGGEPRSRRGGKRGRGRGGQGRGRGGRGGMNRNQSYGGSCGNLSTPLTYGRDHQAGSSGPGVFLQNNAPPPGQTVAQPPAFNHPPPRIQHSVQHSFMDNRPDTPQKPLSNRGFILPGPRPGTQSQSTRPPLFASPPLPSLLDNGFTGPPPSQSYSNLKQQHSATGRATGQKSGMADPSKPTREEGRGRQGPQARKELDPDHRQKEESKQQATGQEDSTLEVDPVVCSQLFNLLLRQFQGRTKMGTLMSKKGDLLKGFSHAKAEEWLKKSQHFLIYEKDSQVKAVSVYCRKARMCYKYRKHNTDICENAECKFFHICRDFVAGNCYRGSKCNFNHSFHTQSNARICKTAGLQAYTDDEIRMIVLRSTIVVCSKFNSRNCKTDCLDIHVCSKFIKNDCSEEDCEFGHIIKETEHNNWVLDMFHMKAIQEGTLRRMVVSPNISKLEEDENKNLPAADAGPDPCNKGARPKKPQDKPSAVGKPACREPFPDALSADSLQSDNSHKGAERKKQPRQSNTVPRESNMVRDNDYSSHPVTGMEERESELAGQATAGLARRERKIVTDPKKSLQIKPDGKYREGTEMEGREGSSVASHYEYLCEQHTWKGTCSRGFTCPRGHHRQRPPYVWQLRVFDKWSSFSDVDNVDIEERFCALADEDTFEVVLDDVGGLSLTIDFEEMTAVNSMDASQVFTIRRWATPSYVEGGDSNTPLNFYTQWCWFMNINGKFMPFNSPSLQYTLEEKHCRGQEKYYFEQGEEDRYMLSLRHMVLCHLGSGSSMAVRCRPFFTLVDHGGSAPHMSDLLLREPPAVHHGNLPSHWSSLDHFQDFEMVEMEASSSEYGDVKRSFYTTLKADRASILRIFRVQNSALWDKFCSTKRAMTPRDGGSEEVDERKLFHGTPSLLAARGICTNNMDFRRAGESVGTRYGKGSYFSTSSAYSHNYTRGPDRYMFLARVLVGKYTLGQSSYKMPPVREGLKLYDSCVDDVNKPTIFVIFDLAQSYPEYLVQYEETQERFTHDRMTGVVQSGPSHRRVAPPARPFPRAVSQVSGQPVPMPSRPVSARSTASRSDPLSGFSIAAPSPPAYSGGTVTPATVQRVPRPESVSARRTAQASQSVDQNAAEKIDQLVEDMRLFQANFKVSPAESELAQKKSSSDKCVIS